MKSFGDWEEKSLTELENRLIHAMEALDEEVVMECACKLQKGILTFYQIQVPLNEGMKRVGKLFEAGEYFIADLMFSGILYNQVIQLYAMEDEEILKENCITVMMAVTQNDIHDIGKDIIASILRAEGFRIIDLGVDVGIEEIIKNIKKYEPAVLILSGTMSYSIDEMKHIIEMLSQENLRDKVEVLIGGTSVNDNGSIDVGADACSIEPMETVMFCRKVMVEKGA